MIEINELLGDLISKSNYYWLNPNEEAEYVDLDLFELTKFTNKTFDILRKEKRLEELIPFILGKLEEAHQFFEYYQEYCYDNNYLEQIYSVFYDIFEQKLLNKNEFKSLESDFLSYFDSGYWEEVDFGLSIINCYKEFLSPKTIDILSELLFYVWEDIESKYEYDDSHDKGYYYHREYMQRRDTIISIIYNIDKKALEKSLERVFNEGYIGWGTSWDKLLAAEYLIKFNKKKWIKTYFRLIIADLSSLAESEIEREFDHKIARSHLLNLENEEAIDLFVKFFTRDKLYKEELIEYINAIKMIVGKNNETIKYFYTKATNASKSFPLGIFIEILEKECNIDFYQIINNIGSK